MAITTEIPQYLSWALPLLIIGILVQFLWSSIVSFTVYRLTRTDRNFETLKQQLHDVTTKLVDERFRAMTHDINTHVNGFKLTLDSLTQSLGQAQKQVDELYDGDHQIQLSVAEKIAASRELIREQAADKIEFKEFCREVRDGREVLLQALSDLKREVVTTEDLKRVIQEVRRG